MPRSLDELYAEINRLQDEAAEAIAERARQLGLAWRRGKVRFDNEVIRRQKAFRTSVLQMLRHPKWLTILTAPFIYALIVPFVLLDAMVMLYQHTCFRVYRIPIVPRRDYIVIDRHRLAYLNALQKLNCVYCGYANGLLAYVSEVASRTEAYWCPIKHAARLAHYHQRYGGFSDYGDAEDFLPGFERNRAAVQTPPKEAP